MSETFAENFQLCCSESAERLAIKKSKTDPEHQEDRKKRDVLRMRLCSLLGPQQALLADYDEAVIDVFAFDGPYVYQQGFRDCVYLLRWIGAL